MSQVLHEVLHVYFSRNFIMVCSTRTVPLWSPDHSVATLTFCQTCSALTLISDFFSVDVPTGGQLIVLCPLERQEFIWFRSGLLVAFPESGSPLDRFMSYIMKMFQGSETFCSFCRSSSFHDVVLSPRLKISIRTQ